MFCFFSGKSTFVKNLIKYSKEVFDQPFSRIVYCCPSEIYYEDYSRQLKELFPSTEIHHGIPSVDGLQFRTDKLHKLIIVDDMFDAAVSSVEINNIFTAHSHHFNISIILIGHNFFTKAKFSTTIARNTSAKIIFFDKADQLFLSTMSRRLFPAHPNLLNEAFEFLIEKYPQEYSKYLVVDTASKSHLPRQFMVRSNIFPEKDGETRPIFFTP